MKIKNITAALLVLCIMTVNSVFAQKSEDYTKALNSLEIFKNLSVTLPEKNMQDTVTRAEFVSMIMHASEGNDFSVNGTSFSDVNAEYKYAGEIYGALTKGIISLTDEFSPDENISYADAYTMAVRFLGRDQQAVQKGAYPNGYLVVAHDCGLNKDILGNSFEELTFSDALVMLKNMAECEMICIEQITSSGIEFKLGDSLFEEKYDMFEIKGIETANEYTTLFEDDKHSAHGKIRINDDEYRYSGKDYLGYSVRGYAREIDGDNYIVYAEPYTTATADVLLKDISLDNGDLREDGDVKSKKYSVEADVCIVYNGKAANKLTVDDIDKMKDGHITLIDNDDNGKYDVLCINEYSVIRVSRINIYDETILDENGNDFLDLSDKDINYTVVNNGNEISLEEIKTADILCVYKSIDEKLIKIVLESETVNGKLSGVNKEDKTVSVGEETYECSDYVENFCLPTAVIGQEYSVTVSEYGTVVYMQMQTNDDIHYGYLVSGYEDESGDEHLAQIYTDEGNLDTYKLAEKVRLNDKSSVKAAKVYGEFKNDNGINRQLIRFKVNQNKEIVMIDTQDKEGRIDSDANPNDRLSKFKFPANVAPTLWYITGNTSFHPYFYITDETKIFVVSQGENVENKDRCTLKTAQYFNTRQSQKSANLNVYDVSQAGVAGAVVIYDNSNLDPQVTTDSYKGIVYSVSPAVDLDENDTYRVVVYVNGEYKTYYVNSNYLDKYAADGKLNYIHAEGSASRRVEKGDCIGFEVDNYGKISALECYYDLSEGTTTKNLADNSTGTHTAKGVIYSGRVYACDGAMITIIPDGVPGMGADVSDETARFSFRIDRKVYVVNAKGTNIYESDLSELLPYKQVGDSCSRIVIGCNDGVVSFAAVYKR